MQDGSVPTALSSGVAIPSVWSSSATKMWAGRTSGLPAAAAFWTAACSAACALVVGLKLSTSLLPLV